MSRSLSQSQPSKELSAISDYFIALSNDTGNLITNLKLQKLVYYVQAWHLGIFSRQAFDEEFEAWIHGPVIPKLYRKYKESKYHPILKDQESSDKIFDRFSPELQTVMNEVTEEYFGRTAYELEQLTHSETPWLIARAGIAADQNSNQVIEKDAMKDYYGRLVNA